MLIKCIECNHDVSEYADRCPNCGCPIDIIKKRVQTESGGNKAVEEPIDSTSLDTSEITSSVCKNEPEECEAAGMDLSDFEINGTALIRYKGDSTTVIIPEGITSIQPHAFCKAINCKEIHIPKTINSIGGGFAESYGEIVYTVAEAFSGCKNLEKLIVDKENEKYSSYNGILYNKDKTELLVCPCAVEENIHIPEGVTEISYEAFNECCKIFSISMPNSVKKIGKSAFSKCEKLKTINLSNNLQKLGIGAFSECTALTNITIPGSLKTINVRTFEDCINLEHIEFETGVECIWNLAFAGCEKIEKITLPSSVTEIGSSAFCACSELKEIFIPRSVHAIYEEGALWTSGEAFEGCEKLLIRCDKDSYAHQYAIKHYIRYSLITDESKNVQEDVENVQMDLTDFRISGVLLEKYIGSAESIDIPNFITTIGCKAFSGNTSLKKLVIPKNVEKIGLGAFSECSSLMEVFIPNSIKSTCAYTFSDCMQLIKVEIQNGIETIDQYMFCNCVNLAEIIIPASVKEIDLGAFENCKALTKITLPNQVTHISDNTFKGCVGLSEVEIPDSVTDIGDEVFCNCINLTSIKIPKSVIYIGEDVFYNCKTLKKVYLPNSLYVSDCTFEDCHPDIEIIRY